MLTAPKPSEDQRDRSPSSSNLPVPDPTVQTTQLVDRALAAYRAVVDARLRGIDVAVQLVREQTETTVAHQREDVDRQHDSQREYLIGVIDRVKAISDERFVAVDTRFGERDTRAVQQQEENRISLAAALAAQKEAVDKQNTANNDKIAVAGQTTQSQIDSLVASMAASTKSTEDKLVAMSASLTRAISDLKERLDRGEGQSRGTADAHTDQRLNIGQILLALSVVIAAAGLIVAIVVSRA